MTTLTITARALRPGHVLLGPGQARRTIKKTAVRGDVCAVTADSPVPLLHPDARVKVEATHA